LSPTEFRQAESTLNQLVEARRQFNVRAYLSLRMLRSERVRANRLERQCIAAQPITLTTKESSMKEITPADIHDHQQKDDSSPIKHANKSTVMKTIKMMRDQAVMGDRANMTSDFGIAGLMASLSDIESSINAAGCRDEQCENPEQKASAERKVIALMERKRQLELQLAHARQRQLNVASGTVRVSGKGK
jgi:hypothetical protein